MSPTRLRWTRAGVAAVVALDLLALVGLAVQRTTTQAVTTLSDASVPSPLGVPRADPTAVGPAPVSAPPAVAPGSTVRTGRLARPAAPAIAPPAQPTPAPTASRPVPRAAPPVPPLAPPDAAPTCKTIPLPAQSSNGGLQTLIGFAPAFGPFTSEAFAMAAAYAPVLSLVGPVLAQYPAYAPVVEPLVLPLLSASTLLLNAGADAVGPAYAPYRSQVIAAQTQLAAVLAPLAQQLTSSEVGACLIALQNTALTVPTTQEP